MNRRAAAVVGGLAVAVAVAIVPSTEYAKVEAHEKFTVVTTVVPRPRLPAPTMTATTAPAQPPIPRAAPGVVAKQTVTAQPA